MGTILDLRECPKIGLFYGSRAGQKAGILVEGGPWMANYSRTTRGLKGRRLPSYASSPVSERIGSRVHASLGIPAQDVTVPDARPFEFDEVKNSLSDEDEGFSSALSDGESVYLSDVLAAIEASELL